jgi:Zn-dependent alcohol dehydrogenase
MHATAVRLIQHGQRLQVQDVDLPRPSADEAVIEVAYSG